MNQKRVLWTFNLVSLVLFSGCATTLSKKEKASLTTVGLAFATIDPGAYKEPDTRENPGSANVGGSTIDASVVARQQRLSSN